MSRRFIGRYNCTLDEKSRIVLPSRLRQMVVPPEIFTLTLGANNCLVLLPDAVFEDIASKLESYTFTNPDAAYFTRLFAGCATKVVFDRNFRVHLSADLRKMVGITREILCNGTLNRIELWDPKVFEEYTKDQREQYAEAATHLLL